MISGPTKNLLQELNQMDDRMTEQMLKIQENSNRLGMFCNYVLLDFRLKYFYFYEYYNDFAINNK